jgi:hypothetical protein
MRRTDGSKTMGLVNIRRWLPLLVLMIAGTMQTPEALAQVSIGNTYQLGNQTINNGLGMSAGTRFQVFACLSPESEAGGISQGSAYRVEAGCPFAQAQGLAADDDDGDGIGSGTENDAPNKGDANNDGMADSTEGNVTSFESSTGRGYITVELPPGNGPCSQLLNVTPEPPPANDLNYFYPFGLVSFKVNCSGPLTFTLIFHHGNGYALSIYRKFGRLPPYTSPAVFYNLPNVTFGTVNIPGEGDVPTATFTLQDGMIGDDTNVDGMIIDQGGPAIPLPKEVPVASPAGLLAMAFLLICVGWVGFRRSQRRSPLIR